TTSCSRVLSIIGPDWSVLAPEAALSARTVGISMNSARLQHNVTTAGLRLPMSIRPMDLLPPLNAVLTRTPLGTVAEGAALRPSTYLNHAILAEDEPVSVCVRVCCPSEVCRPVRQLKPSGSVGYRWWLRGDRQALRVPRPRGFPYRSDLRVPDP